MPAFAIVGAVIGGAISSIGASKAAGAQAKAAQSAAELQHQDAMASLQFQKDQSALQQKNIAPWLKAGGAAENTLAGLLGTPGEGLLTPWTEQFQAPTNVTEQNDPGYQFRLQQGEQALQNSAAARGGLLSGNTAQAITQYGQDYASNEYQNVYNRAYNQYATRYNQFQTNQANEFNRLSTLAGGGQVAANELNANLGQTAGNVANIYATQGQQVGNSLQNAGAARASGYVGVSNALSGIFGNIQQSLLLSSLLGGQH
jgi:hypothetical protein